MKHEQTNASLFRRLAANFYDLLLLLGVLFVASAIAVAINGGVAVQHPAYYLALSLVTFGFFGWFWTHGGETLGLRTWRLRLISEKSDTVTWKQAAIRFVCAFIAYLPVGLGLLWMLVDKDKLALHDKLSSTRLIILPKRS